MNIELKDLFLKKLESGINLFTGAGFSVLPNLKGEFLPTADQLCDEIQKEFGLSDEIVNDHDLPYISEFCSEQEYQDFLRKRFTVTEYNPLYNVINKINIRTYATTNIDNIFRLVIEKNNRYYLRSILEYGASMNGNNEISYIPLHGEVTNTEIKLYFKYFDLVNVDRSNEILFNQVVSNMIGKPILFWGYGFKDSGVLKMVKTLIENGTSDIWMQFLPGDSKNIALYRNKNCHIIEATTEELLKWIDKNIAAPLVEKDISLINDSSLKKYFIPTITSVAKIPGNDYYQHGDTGWYPILANVAYERSLVSSIENKALKIKNIIISGCRFSGKSTILMQLASRVDFHNKLFIDGIGLEEAGFIGNKIKDKNVWIFFNNCTDCIDAYTYFANIPNVTLIGVSEEYKLETVKHILDKNINYSIIDCSEITRPEALLMYEKIPEGIRRSKFSYKQTEDEKYSALEFVAQNVVNAYTESSIKRILYDLKKESSEMFTIVALATYLSENGSALTYSNVANILNLKVFLDAVSWVNKTIGFLRCYDLNVDDNEEQDFYVLRSKLFAIITNKLLISYFKKDYADIIKRFVLQQSMYSIVRYNVFRKKAYDGSFFAKLFSKKEANAIYKELYEFDHNAYTLQQWALCLMEFKDYQEAFLKIDKAIGMKPNNFSFKNSQAIIMFESNKEIETQEAMDSMRKAMETLRLCYTNDNRKVYHAQKFGEFAIFLYKNHHIKDYIEEAYGWLNEIMKEDIIVKPYTIKLVNELNSILQTF
ncbi:TPA: SIR2 family protein [Candidatus Scatousia excrementigallinarum]|uniref:SIR2 family protein n=1 Tax=Candidatus Scatousia excrementigallinarum TaxID=2840935 RepID=A0A9D1EZ55_9BACT|nr:SIR2 family protein [Candidatus Scatousia excrementigallinarum]